MMYMRELELYPKDLAMFFVFLLMVADIDRRFHLCSILAACSGEE